MSVSDGQQVNAAVTNNAFISRLEDSNTTAQLDLNDTNIASGASITNAQREHNSIASFTGKATNSAQNATPTWASDAIGVASQAIKPRVDAVQADVEDIRSLTGTTIGDTDLGAFSGSIITNNVTIKAALQELETALENVTDALDFQGVWNATTNTPTLTSSVGTKGHAYVVDVAGSTTLNGISDWQIGDWAVFDGSVWRKVDNSENFSIDRLNDVDTTTTPPAVDEVLKWDGANWVPGQGGGVIFQEVPAGTPNGVLTSFGPLTFVPTQDESILVLVDGVAQRFTTEWSYSAGNIIFVTPPATGQQVYVFYSTSGTPISPPSFSNVFKVEYRTLTVGEATAKQITLVQTPAMPSEVILDVISIGPQFISDDFSVSGAVLSWTGLGLDGVLATGDKLRVTYVY